MAHIGIVVVASLCVLCSSAYDFKDSAFNELILEEILDLISDSDTPVAERHVRAAESSLNIPLIDDCKGKKKDRGGRCCNDAMDFKRVDLLKMVKKECLEELHGNESDVYFKFDPFTCDKLEELKNDVTCIAECVGKKFGVLDDDGNLRRNIFLTHLKMKFANTDWKMKSAEKIVDKCMKEVERESKTSVVKRDVTTREMKICNPASLKISQCMWREYVKACPKELQITTPKCNKLRERIEKGDAVTYKGFYLRHLNDDK